MGHLLHTPLSTGILLTRFLPRPIKPPCSPLITPLLRYSVTCVSPSPNYCSPAALSTCYMVIFSSSRVLSGFSDLYSRLHNMLMTSYSHSRKTFTTLSTGGNSCNIYCLLIRRYRESLVTQRLTLFFFWIIEGLFFTLTVYCVTFYNLHRVMSLYTVYNC